MKIKFAESASGDVVAAPVYAGNALSEAAKALDAEAGGALERALKASRFKGEPGQTLDLAAPAGVKADKIVLFGLGGIFVEVLQDTSLRVAPVGEREIREMNRRFENGGQWSKDGAGRLLTHVQMYRHEPTAYTEWIKTTTETGFSNVALVS